MVGGGVYSNTGMITVEIVCAGGLTEVPTILLIADPQSTPPFNPGTPGGVEVSRTASRSPTA